MHKEGEVWIYSSKELMQDYINEFAYLDGYLDMLKDGIISKDICISTFKSLFDEHKGKAVSTFLERTKEKYGVEQIPEEYKEEIEKLNTLVEGINSLFTDFFNNQTTEDADSFIASLTPLVKESISIINTVRKEKEPKE